MFLFFEFLIYTSFFIYKIYLFLDKKLYISYRSKEIDEYINRGKKIKFKFNYKFILYSIFISINLTTLKIFFSYKFIISNFYVITIFSKTINISNILGYNFSNFKILFFLIYFLFYYFVSFKLFNIYNFLKNKYSKKDIKKYEFDKGMYIGESDNNSIYLKKQGMYQNVLITGSIGSGKTSCAISNFLSFFIFSNINGLILDVKGNYIDTVKLIGSKYNKKIIEITLESDFKYNPLNLKGVSNLEIASRVIKVLKLLSENTTSDSYFLDKSEGYIKDFLYIMQEYDKVNFKELHELVINKNYLKEKLKCVKSNMLSKGYDDEKLFDLKNSINNLFMEYLNLDTRTFSIISSEITRITSVFVSDYNIYNKFCKNSDYLDFRNNTYILSLNISKNNKLAKVIATYLKLEFQYFILSKKGKSTFLMCDEYQEFANKEDSKFFSLSREFKCINVIAMQSYSSLLSSLNNKYTVDVIIQNFINKIWFRNDDIYTIEKIIKQIGKIEKEKLSLNVNQNLTGFKYNFIKKDFSSNKSNFNKGYTKSFVKENIIDFNYFTKYLKTFEAVINISDGIETILYKQVKLKRWNENE